MRIVDTVAVPVGNVEDNIELYNLMLRLREYVYYLVTYGQCELSILTRYDVDTKNKYGIPFETLVNGVIRVLQKFNKDDIMELLSMEFDNTNSEYKHISKHLVYRVVNNGTFNALLVNILGNDEPEANQPKEEPKSYNERRLEKLHREIQDRLGTVISNLTNSIKEDPIKALCGPYDGKGVLKYDKPGATDGTQFRYVCEFSYERKLFNMFIKSMPDIVTFEDRVSLFSNSIIILRQFVVNVYSRLEPVLRSRWLQELGIMTKIPYRRDVYSYDVYTTLRNAYDVVTMLATLGDTRKSLVSDIVIRYSIKTKEAVSKELEYVTTVMLEELIDKLNVLLFNTLNKYAYVTKTQD